MQRKIQEIAERILKSKRVAVLTGAGISAESGVPTFRDALTGLWEKYDPMELATPEAFRRNPEFVWKWYRYRRELVLKTKPNPGHYALKKLEDIKEDYLLITQNVDGLHYSAGSRKIVELHGNIMKYRCFNNCIRFDDLDAETPIRCEKCRDWIRPDVVWFGESLPESAITKSIEFINNCDILLSIGTSGVVYPAASFPSIAKSKGSFVAEINLEPTPISDIADISVYGKSGTILPEIISKLNIR